VTPDEIERAAVQLRHQLATNLAKDGHLRSPQWRAAVEAVPRHEFVPQFFNMVEGSSPTLWEPIDPERSGAEQWLRLAYSDASLVTQLDGHLIPADATEAVTGNPTSSATMPSLVLRMWEDLDVQDGHRVLEIGTGTGYSTALGSERLGDDQITSVEVDSAVAKNASAALARAGFHPHLVVGDGRAGQPDKAPYDRVIATCSFRHVPPAWLEQSKPGTVILVTLTGWLHASGLARLTVSGPGTAEGTFLPGDVGFMTARAHAAGPAMIPDLAEGKHTERAAVVDPNMLTDSGPALMVAQLATPNTQYLQLSADEGTRTHLLVDTDGSHAAFTQDAGEWKVRQGGPQALWDKVETALATWHASGEPRLETFRITVTPSEQVIDIGDGLSGTLPT
jgi:methyltransferase of ATP-grasp peptide maturase system